MQTQAFFTQSPMSSMVNIADGANMFALSLSDFKEVEPDYALPANAVGVNWSFRDGAAHLGFWFPGSDVCDYSHTDLTWDFAPQYIGNIAKYRAYIALQLVNNTNPFFRATDVATARQIAVTLINSYFDTNLTTMMEDTTLADTTGQPIFLLSLIEAMMFMMDNTIATPLIDAQILPSQTKTIVIEQIIRTKNRFVPVLNQIRTKKTTLFGLMDPAVSNVSDVISYVNSQIGTTYPGGS